MTSDFKMDLISTIIISYTISSNAILFKLPDEVCVQTKLVGDNKEVNKIYSCCVLLTSPCFKKNCASELFLTSPISITTLWHSRPQRPRSFWLANQIFRFDGKSMNRGFQELNQPRGRVSWYLKA